MRPDRRVWCLPCSSMIALGPRATEPVRCPEAPDFPDSNTRRVVRTRHLAPIVLVSGVPAGPQRYEASRQRGPDRDWSARSPGARRHPSEGAAAQLG